MAKREIRQIVRGEYVATPIKGAFNESISFWLSKKNCTLSIYMFTVLPFMTQEDIDNLLSEDGFKAYIPIFEECCRRPYNRKIVEEEVEKLPFCCLEPMFVIE